MTKKQWQEHIDGILPAGIIRPSLGGDKEQYRAWYNEHLKTECPECNARRKTRRANENARMKRNVYALLGMKRVVGMLGGVYYE
jgi:hypothetical protein